MSLLAPILTAATGGLALIHVLCGIGLWRPIRDERALARAVVGARGISRMPGAVACALVAAALLVCAALPTWPAGTFRVIGLSGARMAFALRGGTDFLPAWRSLVPEVPFATHDRRVYGPMCLALDAGFLALAAGS
jgi:hypothetical protein